MAAKKKSAAKGKKPAAKRTRAAAAAISDTVSPAPVAPQGPQMAAKKKSAAKGKKPAAKRTRAAAAAISDTVSPAPVAPQGPQDNSPAPEPGSFLALYAVLDLKEQAFVDEYVECLNAALAARRIYGVTAAKQKGYALLQRADVAAAIAAALKEQRERTQNDPERIIRELMTVAYVDLQDLVDETGKLLPLRDLAPEIRRAIASVKARVTEDGAQIIEYKLVPKTHALELLGKRNKMWTDRKELDVSDSLATLIGQAFNRPAPAISDIKNSAEPGE